jgi:hypothetical protein
MPRSPKSPYGSDNFRDDSWDAPSISIELTSSLESWHAVLGKGEHRVSLGFISNEKSIFFVIVDQGFTLWIDLKIPVPPRFKPIYQTQVSRSDLKRIIRGRFQITSTMAKVRFEEKEWDFEFNKEIDPPVYLKPATEWDSLPEMNSFLNFAGESKIIASHSNGAFAFHSSKISAITACHLQWYEEKFKTIALASPILKKVFKLAPFEKFAHSMHGLHLKHYHVEVVIASLNKTKIQAPGIKLLEAYEKPMSSLWIKSDFKELDSLFKETTVNITAERTEIIIESRSDTAVVPLMYSVIRPFSFRMKFKPFMEACRLLSPCEVLVPQAKMMPVCIRSGSRWIWMTQDLKP